MDNYIKKRNKLLKTFDNMSDSELVVKLIELDTNLIPMNPEIARAGLHKARLYVTSIPNKLKEESVKWLTERGYSLKIF